jgi:hypothetical protein
VSATGRGADTAAHTAPDTRKVAGGEKPKRKRGRRGRGTARSEARLIAQGDYETLRVRRARVRTERAEEEGADFERPAGKDGSDDVLVARRRGREKGERLPKVTGDGA